MQAAIRSEMHVQVYSLLATLTAHPGSMHSLPEAAPRHCKPSRRVAQARFRMSVLPASGSAPFGCVAASGGHAAQLACSCPGGQLPPLPPLAAPRPAPTCRRLECDRTTLAHN